MPPNKPIYADFRVSPEHRRESLGGLRAYNPAGHDLGLKDHPQHQAEQDEFHQALTQGHIQEHILPNTYNGYSIKKLLVNGQTRKRYLAKDYLEHDQAGVTVPGEAGFAEMATKALYHAGGIPHLTHNPFVYHLPIVHMHNATPARHPSVIIPLSGLHTENGHDRINAVVANPPDQSNPIYQRNKQLALDDLHKIRAMDYLLSNSDRASNLGNILFSPNSMRPLAIDNGMSFVDPNFTQLYPTLLGDLARTNNMVGDTSFPNYLTPENIQAIHNAADWWNANKHNMASRMAQTVNESVYNPHMAKYYEDLYTAKAKHLDDFYTKVKADPNYLQDAHMGHRLGNVPLLHINVKHPLATLPHDFYLR